MTTPEGKIEKHLKKEVEKTGGKVRKLKWIGKSGAPDRLIWWPGISHVSPTAIIPRAAFVELKARGKKPTRVQQEEHDSFRADGWPVFVVDSVDEANKVVCFVRDGKTKPMLDPVVTIDKPPRKRRTPVYDVKTPDHIIEAQDNEDLL